MSARADARPARMSRRLVILAAVGAVLALIVAANAHLVYVAVESRPDCVPHMKAPGGDGVFRAARSAC